MLLDSGAGNRPSRKSSRDRICSSPMPTKYSKLVTAQEISNNNGSDWTIEGFSLIYRDKLDQYRDNESLWKQFGFGYNLITAREHRLGTLKTEYSFIRYITVCQSRTGSTP